MKRQSNRGFGTFEALCVMAAITAALIFLAIDNHPSDVSLEEVGRQQYLMNIVLREVVHKWNAAVESRAIDPADYPDIESRIWALAYNSGLELDDSVGSHLRAGRVSRESLVDLLEPTDSGGLRLK